MVAGDEFCECRAGNDVVTAWRKDQVLELSCGCIAVYYTSGMIMQGCRVRAVGNCELQAMCVVHG